MKSSEVSSGKGRLHGGKRRSPYIFSKEIFTLWGILRSPVAGLPPYLLGKQGVRDAMFLPETFYSLILEKGIYYKP